MDHATAVAKCATLSTVDPTEPADSGTTVHQDVPAGVSISEAVATFASLVGVPVESVTVTHV